MLILQHKENVFATELIGIGICLKQSTEYHIGQLTQETFKYLHNNGSPCKQGINLIAIMCMCIQNYSKYVLS